jgi:chromosome segregation ATPase
VVKDADRNLTCRQCGREFVFTKAEQEFYELKGFTLPGRCPECRSPKQSQPHHLVCSQCGTELEKGATTYCAACLARAHLEFELKAKQSQRTASAAHAKLLASESQKAELAESLRQKEQLVADLELQVNSLSQDLDKAYQFQAALGPLQSSLNGIEERLEALEHAHDKINERMLQVVQKMHEMYDNTGLLEIIKRSLKHYQRQGT